jgi:RNA polymerase sigma-70 factor (ECF subfamily)
MGAAIAIVDSTQRPNCIPCDGERSEMDGLVSCYWPSFYRTAYRYLGNAADAEDAVQDALLSAYKHVSEFRRQARISTWVTAIVINSVRTQLRRRRSQPHGFPDEQLPEQESDLLGERLPDRRPGPEEECRRAELAERVVKFSRQLSLVLRRAFSLRHVDGLTIREIADVLGVTESSAKARLSRARAKLKLLMSKKPPGQIQTGFQR